MTCVLLDVAGRRTSPTDADADVVLSKELLGDAAHGLVESSAEEQVAVVAILVGVYRQSVSGAGSMHHGNVAYLHRP